MAADAQTRASERNGAAVVRALGRMPRAEYRAGQLQVHDQPVGLAVPHLMATASASDGEPVGRGVYDAVAVRLRYSDREVFEANEPEPHRDIARFVFDVAEQFRCESLVPGELSGTRANIDAAFRLWCGRQEFSNTRGGQVLYAVMHMVRARLVGPLADAAIEAETAQPRAALQPVIGPLVGDLVEHRLNQERFGVAARALAEAVDEMLQAADPASAGGPIDEHRADLPLPPEWNDAEVPEGPAGAPGALMLAQADEPLETIGGYSVFNASHDLEQDARELYPVERLRFSRRLLEEQVAAQSVSAFAVARRLRMLFRANEPDGWRSGEEEGLLDAARLGQVVANPTNLNVFRQPRLRPTAPAVVTFLLDNSGSMKRDRRHATVGVLVDTLARALDLAGATSEVLGFTTDSMNGGQPGRDWREAGQPPNPGRLAALRHIVYKDGDTSWRRSRLSVAALMRTQHMQASVDGEAIVWAYRRLLARPEARKFLVVLSDGAPVEAATRRANGPGYLATHARNVVQAIEQHGHVGIGAITIDQPVEAVFGSSVHIDLANTLTLSDYRLLERLFFSRR